MPHCCLVGRRKSLWATVVIWAALLGKVYGQGTLVEALPDPAPPVTGTLLSAESVPAAALPELPAPRTLPVPRPSSALPPDPTGEALMPRPGPPIPVGATGPGLNYKDPYPLLNGAFVPETGWPCVLLDHFAPRPERVERLWVVRAWTCPQELGTDTWSSLEVLHFDAQGHLVKCDPRLLLAQIVGHPVLILAQGNLTTPDVALGGLLWTDSWLRRHQALPPDAVMISFDWSSGRVSPRRIIDINEKARRALVGSYHLAHFLQAFPACSRVCLLGQSFGGRLILGTLHLLAGAPLRDRAGANPVRICASCTNLHLRAVVVEAAIDHDWLDPGQRLGSALVSCEGLLNLYNSKSTPVRLYPLLWNSDHHRSFANVALLPRDRERIGPLLEHYVEHDVADLIHTEHTLLRLLAHPQAARAIAPYTWATPPVPPSPERPGI